APWLSVADGEEAVAFYQRGLGAVELYRLEDAGRVAVAELAVDAASFWIQEDSRVQPVTSEKGRTVRLILSVVDPDDALARMVAAGARQIVPVHEEHGWRTGRVMDPFGHDWELSRRI